MFKNILKLAYAKQFIFDIYNYNHGFKTLFLSPAQLTITHINLHSIV